MAHVDFESHSVQEPVHPTTFNVLQRGQRTSDDSRPQFGHLGSMDIQNNPISRAINPPVTKATAIELANRPAK